MELLNAIPRPNEVAEQRASWPVVEQALQAILVGLSPIAPHVCEELWEEFGFGTGVWRVPWPQFDAKWLETETVTIVVQVNGKLRGRLTLPTDVDEAGATDAALKDEKVNKHVAGKTIRKAIFVPGKLLNLVVS